VSPELSGHMLDQMQLRGVRNCYYSREDQQLPDYQMCLVSLPLPLLSSSSSLLFLLLEVWVDSSHSTDSVSVPPAGGLGTSTGGSGEVARELLDDIEPDPLEDVLSRLRGAILVNLLVH